MAKTSQNGWCRVTFSAQFDPGKAVFVAGTFNNWVPDSKPLKDADNTGNYRATLVLPRGKHEYKFVVDGVWCVDPACPDRIPNDVGSLNSVIDVK